MFGKTTDEATARFMKLPVVREMTADMEREEYERRARVVGEIERLRRTAEAEVAAFAPRLAALTTTANAADAARTKALEDLRDVVLERDRLNRRLTRELEAFEAGLIQTADPRIAEFCDEMRAIGDAIRRQITVATGRGAERMSGRADEVRVTNVGSVAKKAAAIQSAITRAQSMKTEAVHDIAGELRRMKTEIDAMNIDQTETVTRPSPERETRPRAS